MWSIALLGSALLGCVVGRCLDRGGHCSQGHWLFSCAEPLLLVSSLVSRLSRSLPGSALRAA
eukprot:10826806-Alexandrium_andersonii.AAC.1